jgi:8-amino-7-oxononanoate synthase
VKICNSDEGPALFKKVLDNAQYLRDGLKRLGFHVVESEPVTAVVPVIIGDDWQAVLFWKALYDAGVYTNVALYPAVPRGGALIRTSVMATHEREHLDRALEIFDSVRDSAQAGEPS